MGKGHKHQQPHRGIPPTTTQPSKITSAPQSPTAVAAPRSLACRIGLQLAALLGLSAALGFTFNAANPIGVRFATATITPAPAASSKTNFSLTSTSSVLVKPPQPATQPSPQPAPQTVQQTATRPVPPQLPPVPTNFPKRAMATPTPMAVSNPAPVVVTPPAQTNLNPAPIHWREAKPLVAAGSALLVDVRLAAVYDAGHIPEAISLPEASSSLEIKAFLELVSTNMTLIVYCSSTSCSQSMRVANRLVTEFHRPSVKYMTGGYQEYQQEELAQPQQLPKPQQAADQ